ncbi:SRPBCC family protein [Oerskovia sp. Sa1BUA8]|uniref:SRPBCC family protein n=1 Tax=Oerskovia douganii TaxID=2762210 RepID=A0A9D5UGJ1_9CELL|nr:SRPBCC family protein [Oerskovia douganii]MBE7700137.1 SRPBCC family protein [Oerskovia douganii]
MRPLVTRTAVAAVTVGALLLTRRMTMTWGTRDDEPSDALAGDEIVPHADAVATRAVTIAAPPREVWRWVVQLGQGRGGFYSYEWLENLVGCDIENADRIEPAWQRLAVGDDVRLHPDMALRVAAIVPERHVVLRGAVPVGASAPPYDFSWSFVLRPAPDGATRLLVRERYGYTRWWAGAVVEPVQPVSFLMSARMLRGIRDRAEGRVGAAAA